MYNIGTKKLSNGVFQSFEEKTALQLRELGYHVPVPHSLLQTKKNSDNNSYSLWVKKVHCIKITTMI